MFDSVANYIEPIIMLVVALVVISGYFRMQEHTVDARESAKIQKAEIYANAKVQSAKIQAMADNYGFDDTAEESGFDMSAILPLLSGQGSIEDFLKTPKGLEVAQQFLQGHKPT